MGWEALALVRGGSGNRQRWMRHSLERWRYADVEAEKAERASPRVSPHLSFPFVHLEGVWTNEGGKKYQVVQWEPPFVLLMSV